MTVLDAFAVLALLKSEPAAPQVREIIEAGDGSLTPLGVAEVVDHLVRLLRSTEEEAALDIAQLGLSGCEPIDASVARSAGFLRARHYHRSRRSVSLADCMAAAVATNLGGHLATADPHLLDLCYDEAIDTVVLPDSSGRLWSHRAP